MKRTFWLAGIFLLSLTGLQAQSFQMADLGNDQHYFYLNTPFEVKGVMVLLPGFGQPAVSVFPESKLPNVAFSQGLITVVIPYGNKLYVDSPTGKWLDKALKDVLNRFDLRPDQVVMGGFSAGGTIALRYTEMCYQEPNKHPVLPQAVFSIDGPIDLIQLWNYCQREISRGFSEVGVSEAKFVQSYLENDLDGTPKTNLQAYLQHTPFYSLNDGVGNEKYLLNLPVRCYHDADIVWQIENRRRSVYDMNVGPGSALINTLRILGNEQAELILNNGAGRRKDGSRHPHSWNIVDEAECIQWLLKALID